MSTHEYLFEYERSTKSKYRFRELEDQDREIGTIYVDQSVFDERPRIIRLTLEVVK